MENKLVYRMKDLNHVIGLGKSKIYMMISAGEFPEPIELGPNAVGWPAEDVRDWVRSRSRRELQQA